MPSEPIPPTDPAREVLAEWLRTMRPEWTIPVIGDLAYAHADRLLSALAAAGLGLVYLRTHMVIDREDVAKRLTHLLDTIPVRTWHHDELGAALAEALRGAEGA